MGDPASKPPVASSGSPYHDSEAISSGDIRAACLVSLYHFKYRGRLTDSTPAMRLGSAVHTLLNEPDYYDQRHPRFQGTRRYGKSWEYCKADNPQTSPEQILTEAEHAKVLQIVAALKRHPKAKHWLQGGVSEVEIFWTDEATGLRCRAKPDRLWPHTIIDIKSTNSRNFGKDRLRNHALHAAWHVQVAWYAIGARTKGFDIQRAVLLVAESEEPFDVVVMELSDRLFEEGLRICRQTLDRIAEAERTNTWPGVGGDEFVLDLPLPWPPTNDPADDDASGEDDK